MSSEAVASSLLQESCALRDQDKVGIPAAFPKGVHLIDRRLTMKNQFLPVREDLDPHTFADMSIDVNMKTDCNGARVPPSCRLPPAQMPQAAI